MRCFDGVAFRYLLNIYHYNIKNRQCLSTFIFSFFFLISARLYHPDPRRKLHFISRFGMNAKPLTIRLFAPFPQKCVHFRGPQQIKPADFMRCFNGGRFTPLLNMTQTLSDFDVSFTKLIHNFSLFTFHSSLFLSS